MIPHPAIQFPLDDVELRKAETAVSAVQDEGNEAAPGRIRKNYQTRFDDVLRPLSCTPQGDATHTGVIVTSKFRCGTAHMAGI